MKGTLRDKFLEEALPESEYFKLHNHTFSKEGLSLKSQAKSLPVTPDIYESGKTENEVRKDVHKFLKKYGYIPVTMYTGGIPTGLGRLATNPAKGFPDQIVTHPIKKSIFYVELKRNEGGKISPEQQTWHFDLRNCGQTVFVATSSRMLEAEMRRKNMIGEDDVR